MPHHYNWDAGFLAQHGQHFGASYGNFEAHTLPDSVHAWTDYGNITAHGLRTFTKPYEVFMETRQVILTVAEWGLLGPAFRVVKRGAREFGHLMMNNPTIRQFVYDRVRGPALNFLQTTGIYAFLLASGRVARAKFAGKSGRAQLTRGYAPKPKQTILGNQIKTVAAGYKYDSAKFWADIWERIAKALGKEGLQKLAQSLLDRLKDNKGNNMAWFYRRRRTYGRRSYGQGYRRPFRRNYGYRRNYRRGYASPRRYGYRRSW